MLLVARKAGLDGQAIWRHKIESSQVVFSRAGLLSLLAVLDTKSGPWFLASQQAQETFFIKRLPDLAPTSQSLYRTLLICTCSGPTPPHQTWHMT